MTPGQRKQRRYERARRSWCEEIGFPWPDKADDPHLAEPGVLDMEDEEQG